MFEFLKKLFETDFMPHGHCYFWRPEILWLHVVSDAVIALSYYSIPLALLYFVRKRHDLAFKWIFVLFGVFIFACGTTHVMGIWVIWNPTYRLDGMVKLATAGVSLITAHLLWLLIPKAMALPSPAEVRRAHNELQEACETLEKRVTERTQELTEINQRLRVEIDEHKQTQEILQKQKRELARSNADLQQFAYVASHDLQEPLRMVASYTQLLARRYEGKLDADADEFISFACDGATRAQELIRDLVAFSRVGSQGVPNEPTDCNACLHQALTNLRVACAERNAIIHREVLPTVPADSNQLVLVFQNLIGNALRFTAGIPEIHISAERNNQEWIFAVKDNGIGIEARFFDRIFVIFQRLHSKSEYPGSGIGLAICKRIVERHGGRIWVESQPGTGATFFFSLPAQ